MGIDSRALGRLEAPSAEKIRVLVVDDHEMIRKGLRVLLEADPRCEICGEASDGREAVEKARHLRPDVVVLDISMPGLNGLEAARQIRKATPRSEVFALTVNDSEQLAQELLSAGVHGYLLKSDAASALVAGIESLQQHRPFFSPKIAKMVLDGYLKAVSEQDPPQVSSGSLTVRERQIVQLLAEGKSSKEVASTLGVTVKTAETHRANIMRKLNFHSISDLVRYAVRNQIIEA